MNQRTLSPDPGICRIRARIADLDAGSDERSPTIPATESALRLHPCRAVSSAQSTFECIGSDGGASRIGIGFDGLLFPGRAGLTKWLSAHRPCGWRGGFNVEKAPVQIDVKIRHNRIAGETVSLPVISGIRVLPFRPRRQVFGSGDAGSH